MQNLVVGVANHSQHKIMNNKIKKLPKDDSKVVVEMDECIVFRKLIHQELILIDALDILEK